MFSLVGKEVDGFQSHQKLRHVDKFSACLLSPRPRRSACCFFTPVDRRHNNDHALKTFLKLSEFQGLNPNI